MSKNITLVGRHYMMMLGLLFLFSHLTIAAPNPPADSSAALVATLQLRVSSLAANSAVAPGESFSLRVRATNLGEVDSLMISYEWDPLILRLDSVGNFTDPPAFDNSNFDFSQVAAGRLGLSWTNPGGAIIPGFWPLFDMYFTAIGDADTITFVGFGNEPIATNVIDTAGMPVTLDTIPGRVPVFRPLVLCMDTVEVFQSDTICLPITVADFDQILSMQYSQRWDPSLLEFVGFRNFNLPFLESGDFIVNSITGTSRLSWFDDISQPTTVTTLADGDTIYEMCFVAIGPIGDTAIVPFTGDPLSIEIIDSTQCCNIGLINKDAIVVIGSAIKIDSVRIDPVNCYTPLSGRVQIEVSGGESPYTFLWSNGDNTNLADSLGFGGVTVTITDAASNTHTLVREFMIPGNLTPPPANALDDSVFIDCTILPVALRGEPVPGDSIYYFWNSPDGDVVDSLANRLNSEAVLPGTYFFTVVDSVDGCAAQDSVIVYGIVELPTAEAGGLETRFTCDMPAVTLSSAGSSVGDSIAYEWVLDQNVVGTDPSIDVSVGGRYTLRVRNTNTECINIDFIDVVADTFAPDVSTANEYSITCLSDDVLMTGMIENVFGDFFFWTTQNGDLGTDTIAGSQAFALSDGTYTFTAVNTSNGCFDTIATQVVFDTLPPVATLPDSAFLNCQTNQVDVAVQAANGSPFEYRWIRLFGDGEIITDTQQPEVTVEGRGLFQVAVEDTLSNCRSFFRVAVVDNQDIPEIELVESAFLNCITDTLTLQAEFNRDTNGLSFSWIGTEGGKILSGANTRTIILDTAGIYTLITVDQNTQCADTAITNVFWEKELPNVNAGNDTTISCSLASVILGSGETTIGAQVVYKWEALAGGELSSPDSLRFASTNTPGTYRLTVTNLISGCVGVDEVEVSLAPDFFLVDAGTDTILLCTLSPIVIGSANTTVRDSLEYVWSTPISGTGNIVSGEDTPFATIDEPGVYTLVVTDLRQDCAQLAQVTVAPDPSRPVAESAVDGSINCIMTRDTLSGVGSSVGDSIRYTWTYLGSGSGGVVTGANSLFPIVDAPGQYLLEVTNINNGCIRTDTAMVVADVDTPAIALVASSLLDCLTDTVSIDASGSAINANSVFMWEASPTLSDADSVIAKVTAAGSYVFSLTDQLSGCTATDTITVGLDTLRPSLNLVSSPVLSCAENTGILDLSGSGSNVADFSFSYDEISARIQSGENSLRPLLNRAGLIAVQLTNNANGCSRTDTLQIEADTIPPVPNAGNDFDLGCNLGSFTLSGGVAGTTNFSVMWSAIEGQLLSIDTSLIVTAQGKGSYILEATNLDNGCSATDTVEVSQILNLQEANAGPDFAACTGDSAQLAANDPANASGVWTPPAGLQLSDVNDANAQVLGVLPAAENVFIWTLTSDNCPDYDADTVIVFRAEIPDALADVVELEEIPADEVILVIDNDDLPAEGWFTEIIIDPEFGDLELIDEGEYRYILPFQVAEAQQFSYALCNLLCPDLCDTTVVNINVPPFFFDQETLNIPNAITPNDDGLNDQLYFDFLDIFSDRFQNPNIVIFNRWGDIVWEATPYLNDWKGEDMNGNALPQGTYYYVLRLNTTSGEVIKGDVTVLIGE